METGKWKLENGNWKIEAGKWQGCFLVSHFQFLVSNLVRVESRNSLEIEELEI